METPEQCAKYFILFKLIKMTPKRRRSSISIVNFEQILHIPLIFNCLNLSKYRLG